MHLWYYSIDSLSPDAASQGGSGTSCTSDYILVNIKIVSLLNITL